MRSLVPRYRWPTAVLLAGAALAFGPLGGTGDFAKLAGRLSHRARATSPPKNGSAAKGGHGPRSAGPRSGPPPSRRRSPTRPRSCSTAKAGRGLGFPAGVQLAAATVPVYVLRDARRRRQRRRQRTSRSPTSSTVLNTTFAGQGVEARPRTAVLQLPARRHLHATTTTEWHKDKQSSNPPQADPQGRCVRRQHLHGRVQLHPGIATFPWSILRNPGIDGIRVHYDTLPGGSDCATTTWVRPRPDEAGRLGSGRTTPSRARLHELRTTRSPILRRSPVRPTAARPAATRAASPPGTRSTTTWIYFVRFLLQPVLPSGPENPDSDMWTAYRPTPKNQPSPARVRSTGLVPALVCARGRNWIEVSPCR